MKNAAKNKKIIKALKLIVYDFDGVLTDNRVFVSEDGKESVFVNRSDGLAILEIKKMGIAQLILTAERNKVVKVRAKKLGIPCKNNISDKKKAFITYCKKLKISLKEAAYAGNEINDRDVMKIAGFAIAPRDAYKDIKKIAALITVSKGGEGVAREILDILKKARSS